MSTALRRPCLFLGPVLAGALLPGCGAFVPIVKVDQVDPHIRNLAQEVPVYLLGQEVPFEFEIVDGIIAYSAKVQIWDPPATKGNALEQAKIMCVQAGGDALINVGFDSKGVDYHINAWESVVVTCDAVRRVTRSGGFAFKSGIIGIANGEHAKDFLDSGDFNRRIEAIASEVSFAVQISATESVDSFLASELALARVEPLLIDLEDAIRDTATVSSLGVEKFTADFRQLVKNQVSQEVGIEIIEQRDREGSVVERFGDQGGSTARVDRVLRRWNVRGAFQKPPTSASEESYGAWGGALGRRCAELEIAGLADESKLLDRAIQDCANEEDTFRKALLLERWPEIDARLFIDITKSRLLSSFRSVH